MSQPPSFTSFPRSQPSTSHQQQPSFASFPGPNSSSRPRKHKSHEQLVDESSRKKRKHQHQHQHHSAKDRSSSNKTSPAQVKRHEALALQLTVYPRRSSATSTQSIISDTAGDPDFSRYGSLQTSQVPKFRRAGAGRVLGASTGLRIIKSERASRKTLTLLPPNQAHLSRYIDRRNVSKLLDKKRKLYQLLPGQDTSKGKPYAPFIALLEEDMPPEIDSLDEPEYRHTEAPPSASGSDSGSEVDNDRPSILGRGVSYLDKLTSRNAELSAATRERPYDIHAWLDFVAHQDVFLSNTRADFDTQPEGANRSARRIHKERVERRAISETKLDILDKALKLNRSATQLVRERLKIGEDIWTVDELGKEWERSLRKTTMDEENNALWMHWFEWKARDARGFTIRDVLQPAAQEALQNLRSFDHQLHVFDKTMRALRAAGRLSQLSALIPRADDSHAGYRERANATYQALMELNFFCPEKLKLSSLDEQMKELNMHWDSEKLRFGEAGAKGWAHTADDEIPPELSHQPIIDVSNSLPLENESVDGYERWAAQETIAMASRHYSVRTEELDDEKDDDTFRAVSFEKDIQPYLFIITATSTDPKRHVQSLIFSYLSFHGLELLQPGHSTNDSQPPDDLLSPLAMNHFFPSPVPTLSFEVVGGEPMEAARRSGLKSPADGWGRHWPVLQEMLFASEDAGWPSFWSGQDWKRFDCVTLRASLEQLLIATLDDSFKSLLKVILLSLEAAIDPKLAAKVAKTMLADSPTDLRLWDAFARINVCQGLVKTACDVYAKTLQQPHLASQESACFLWASWAELEWRSGNLDRAALILAASTALPGSRESLLSSNTQLKPAQILATRSRFVEATATMKEFPPQWYTHTIIVSAALFEYLMRGLSAACHIFEECCYDAKPLPAFREVLTMSHAKLLYQHTKQQAYQPGLIREVVAEALEQFPANSYLLNLYFFNESKTRIQNRLRSMLDNQVFTSGSTKEAPSNIWLYRIFAETHLDARGFNIRAVQHLFEASVQALQTRPSTSLWQLYLHFASRYCERATVQSVSSRALQECPTIKEFYMHCFRDPARTTFRRNDLTKIHDTMRDKQLRLVVPVEPYLAIDELNFDLPDDASEDSEIDYAFLNLAAKQRLLPY